eukprot:s278_g22.t1
MTVLCGKSTKPRPAVRRFACAGTNLDALGALHPVLAASVKRSLENMPDADLLFIGPKEEIGGVKGTVGNDLRGLRQCEPDSYDFIVEARSEEVLAGGWEARQNRFYPLGGHEFSLSNDFIINLASIAKVLRKGGKFWFLTCASGQDEVLPFSFLALPHLDWQTEVFLDTASGVSAVCCTLNKDTSEDTLRKTPVVVAQECLKEMSRRRYFDALRPYLQSRDGAPLNLLDFGCGDGSLMSWAFDPQVLSEDGPRQITLVESNPELAQRARARLDSVDVFVVEDNAPLPFEDGQFDVVVLAFVLHHVPVPDRTGLLAEAARVGCEILVLEDLPDSAGTPSAQRLAWHVTQEHFRPFGQDPDDYMSGVLSDEKWREFFGQVGLEVLEEAPISQTLRYPVDGGLPVRGAQNRAQLLKQLDVNESSPGPAEAVVAIRKWHQLLQRAADLNIALPDESLQVRSLSTIVKKTAEASSDFKFRVRFVNGLARTLAVGRLNSSTVGSVNVDENGEALLDSEASQAGRDVASHGRETEYPTNPGWNFAQQARQAAFGSMGQLVSLLGCTIRWCARKLAVIHPAHFAELEQAHVDQFERTMEDLRSQMKMLRDQDRHLRSLRDFEKMETGPRWRVLFTGVRLLLRSPKALLGLPEAIPGAEGWLEAAKGAPMVQGQEEVTLSK